MATRITGAGNSGKAAFLAAVLTILVHDLNPTGLPAYRALTFRPFRHQPPSCHFTMLGFARYSFHYRHRCRTALRSHSATRSWASSGTSCTVKGSPSLGSSPTGLAESSSLALRTGRSPQVALHPSSRKRSYHFRLQGSNDTLIGTFTRLINRLHRRTSHGRKPMDRRKKGES